jgi:hypothetical protein
MATVLAIPDLLRSLGANPEEVLRELGYDLKLFDHAETRVTYAIRNHILSHCAARTGCPHFGLLVGQHNGLHSFGLVGPLVKYAPDVGTAMRSFIRYRHLHVQGSGTWRRTATGDAHVADPTGIEAIDHRGSALAPVPY